MAANESVDEIVSPVAFEQLEKLQENVALTTKEIVKLSKEAKKAFDGLGDAKTLLQLVEASRKAQDSTEGMGRKLKALTEEQIKARMETKRLNDELKLKIQLDQAQEGSIAKAALQVKKWTAELRALNLETQKSAADDLRGKIDERNTWIKENVDALSAQRINIGNYPEAMAQMASMRNELEEMSKAGLQNTQVYTDMEGNLKKMSQAMGPTSTQLNALTQSMTFLAAAGKQDTQEFKDLQQQAMALRVNMQYVKTAISGTTGATNLQAEAMHKSKQATFAVSQVLREMPSFAYSVSTGFMGISNNIMPLKDTIDQLKIKNEELIASGQKAIPVWKTLGLAVFSVNGIITLAISAITIISARMTMAGNETKKATDNLTEYTDALEQFYNTSNKMRSDVVSEVKFEESKARSQVKIMQNQTLTLDQRFRAYKELQRIAPQIFDDLDKEGFKTAENTKRINEQVAALDKYIEVQTLISKGRTQQRKNLELIEANEDLAAVKRAEVMEERLKLIRGGNGRMGVAPEWVDKLIREVGTKSEVGIGALDVEKRQAELNKLLKDRLVLEQSAQRLETGLARLDVQRAKMEGNTTSAKDKKSPKDRTLDNENDLTEAIYEEYIKRIQIAAEAQKFISDDETKSLEERLMAYRQYAEMSFDAETVRQVGQLEVINNSLTKIEQIEAKSADKRTQQEKDLLGTKKLLLQQKQNISAEYDLKEVQHIEKTAQAIVAIQQNEVSKRLDAIKLLTANIDIQEAQALEALTKNLKAGTISYAEYTRQKQEIEDKFQHERYQQTADYLQAEIDALAKKGVDTRRMQEALNAALKGLYGADLKNFLDAQKRKEEAQTAFNQKAWEAAGAGISAIQEITDNYYQTQLDNEEKMLEAVHKRRDAQIEAVERSLASEKDKGEQVKAINAQTHLQELQINQEQRRIKRRMAIADRVAALSNIAMSQAQAQAANLVNFVKNAVYGAAIAGLIAAIGLAQTAAVMSKPLPEYGDGIRNHPGGLAVLGDKKEPELVMEPGKAPYWSKDTDTIYDLQPGTSVIPRRFISQEDMMAASMGFMTPSVLKFLGGERVGDNARLEAKLDENASRIERAVKGIPVQNFSLKDGQWESSIKVGGSRITYINKNFD